MTPKLWYKEWGVQQNLVAVASRTPEKAEAFARKFNCEAVTGYENLLNRGDIDAIYMPLPEGLHHEQIMKCLHAGRHVLVEKSIAYNYKSALEMVELAREKKLVLMEDFMSLYHSQHDFVFDLLKKNEVGDIRIFKANFGFPPLPKITSATTTKWAVVHCWMLFTIPCGQFTL